MAEIIEERPRRGHQDEREYYVHYLNCEYGRACGRRVLSASEQCSFACWASLVGALRMPPRLLPG